MKHRSKAPLLPHRSKADQQLLSCAKTLIKTSLLSILLIWASSSSSRKSSLSSQSSDSTTLIMVGKKGTCWEEVKLAKPEGFPALYIKNENGTYSKIPSADINSWMNRLDSWAACHNAQGITEFARVLAPISADGSKLERIFPNGNPAWENLNSTEAYKALIKLANTTALGKPCIAAEDDDKINRYPAWKAYECFLGIVCISNELAFRLLQAATAPNSTTSMYQDIFDNNTSIAYLADGKPHPLSGFIKLNQVYNKIALDPVGTSVQMKMNLITELNSTSKNSSITMWDLGPLFDRVSHTINTIIQREPALKSSTEMEVIIASSNCAKRICSDVAANLKLPDDQRFAGDHVYTQLQMEDKRIKGMTWQEFHIYVNNLLQERLPAQPLDLSFSASKKRKEPHDVRDSLALAGKHESYADPPASFERKWTCNKCGQKGDFPRNCRNKLNQKAPELVEQARQQATQDRLKRQSQSAQRNRLTSANNNAQEQPEKAPIHASGDNYNNNKKPEASNSKKNATNARQERAGLAFVDHDDDSEMCYSSAQLSVHTIEASSALKSNTLLAVTAIACLLGALICGMTTGSGDIPAAAANILIIIGTSTAIMALAPLFGVTAMHIASTKQLLAHAAIIIAMLLLSQLGCSDAASTAFAGSEGAATRSLNSGV